MFEIVNTVLKLQSEKYNAMYSKNQTWLFSQHQ